MSARKLSALIVTIAMLLVIGFTIYKILIGKEVGFQEVVALSTLLMLFFSALTWGNKKEKDGILQEEELGQKITERSSKISYFILLICILGAVIADELVNGTINVFLLVILGIALFLLPLVEYVVAKEYQ